jgi:hypothetical protein
MTTPTRIDRFRELIAAPPTPPPPIQGSELVQPLKDLAEALRGTPGVDADVQTSADGRRYYLALWPRHRPASRAVMVTVAVERGRLVLHDDPSVLLSGSDDFEKWLAERVQTQTFKHALDVLRDAAQEPVDARLERENGMFTLVQVSPEQQAELDSLAPEAAHRIDVPLREREPLPDAAALRRLNSAGVIFDVPKATLTDHRVVHLDLVKR